MALSNESLTPHTQTTEDYLGTVALMRAKALGSQLVNFAHNDDPHPERNATDPAQGIHIRRLVPFRHLPVTQECADHNSRVSGVGSPDVFSKLWGEQ